MPAELGRGERILADPGMAVGGDDQVGIGRDLGSHDQLRIGLHHDLDAGGLGGRRQPVLGVVHHHPGDLDAMRLQHVQRRHAEMTGADKGDPHGLPFLWGRGASEFARR